MKPRENRSDKREFFPDPDSGLSKAEVEYQTRNGALNRTTAKSGKSYARIIVGNIFTFFNILMMAIAACEFIFCGINMITNMMFLVLMITNTLIGTIQECHSKRSIEKLRLLNESKVKIVRDGEETEILPTDMVLSDIAILEAGDQIPADMEICYVMGGGMVEVNESLLTGESRAVRKGPGDPLLCGSYIISGKCRAKATKVGNDTYLHSIEAKAIAFKKPVSPLITSIRRIIKILAAIAIPLGLLVFWNRLVDSAKVNTEIYFIWDEFAAGNIADSDFMEKSILYEPVKWACMTVSYMIPAGMLLLSSVAMATGVVSLARKKALTKDLYSVEALSRVDTLCLDKTGTLTDGTMNVVKQISYSREFSGSKLDNLISGYLSAFSTENLTSAAMVRAYGTTSDLKVSDRIEFSSSRKFSVVEFEDLGLFALGAPEYLTDSDDILADAGKYTKRGIRTILLVKCNGSIKDGEPKLSKRIPVAMFLIQDHIRPEVKSTMEWFKNNDVDIRVISGDNVDTVAFIASECGIESCDRTMDMSVCMDNPEYPKHILDEMIMRTKVFGRVTPEQKAYIVDVLRANGRNVAMTGDGVNDLISLKKADCSIALANGAPATKNVANIVLMDSNFENMKNAVLEGRRVVNNVQRSSTLFIMKDFLWMFLMILPILTGTQHVIESTVMTMVNTMITGVGSVFIALEGDRTRIKGHFIQTVLSRGIVSGFFMFIPILACYIYSFISNGFAAASDTQYEFAAIEQLSDMMPTMAICVTVAGFIVFGRICMPFTKYRRALFAIILAIVVLCLLAAPELFLINGTEYFAELREASGGDVFIMLMIIVGNLFSFQVYTDWIAPYPFRWIFIMVFTAISIPLYIITDNFITKFLGKTLFNKDKFEDTPPESIK